MINPFFISSCYHRLNLFISFLVFLLIVSFSCDLVILIVYFNDV